MNRAESNSAAPAVLVVALLCVWTSIPLAGVTETNQVSGREDARPAIAAVARVDDDCLGDGSSPPRWTHLHIALASLAWRLVGATDRSPTLRQLLSAIECADVRVYVTVDRSVPSSIGGTINFLEIAGEMRILHVALAPTDDPIRLIVNLAHQLWHAREVARNASIVDLQSMVDAFLNRGVVRLRSGQVFWDTPEAVVGTQQIERDLNASDWGTQSQRRPQTR